MLVPRAAEEAWVEGLLPEIESNRRYQLQLGGQFIPVAIRTLVLLRLHVHRKQGMPFAHRALQEGSPVARNF